MKKPTLEELEAAHAALTKKIGQLQARIARREAKQGQQSRRLDTRRKVILGGYELAMRKQESEALMAYLRQVVANPDLREAERAVIVAWVAELSNAHGQS